MPWSRLLLTIRKRGPPGPPYEIGEQFAAAAPAPAGRLRRGRAVVAAAPGGEHRPRAVTAHRDARVDHPAPPGSCWSSAAVVTHRRDAARRPPCAATHRPRPCAPGARRPRSATACRPRSPPRRSRPRRRCRSARGRRRRGPSPTIPRVAGSMRITVAVLRVEDPDRAIGWPRSRPGPARPRRGAPASTIGRAYAPSRVDPQHGGARAADRPHRSAPTATPLSAHAGVDRTSRRASAGSMRTRRSEPSVTHTPPAPAATAVASGGAPRRRGRARNADRRRDLRRSPGATRTSSRGARRPPTPRSRPPPPRRGCICSATVRVIGASRRRRAVSASESTVTPTAVSPRGRGSVGRPGERQSAACGAPVARVDRRERVAGDVEAAAGGATPAAARLRPAPPAPQPAAGRRRRRPAPTAPASLRRTDPRRRRGAGGPGALRRTARPRRRRRRPARRSARGSLPRALAAPGPARARARRRARVRPSR